MPAFNPNLIDHYYLQASLDALSAAFACLGLNLRASPHLDWTADDAPLVVGDATPVIRMNSHGDLELALLPWGIPNRRRPQSATLFNFQPGTQDFALSARVLAPLTRLDAATSSKGLAEFSMVGGIERSGGWTMLARAAPDAPSGRPRPEIAIMTRPASWKAWLARGDLTGR